MSELFALLQDRWPWATALAVGFPVALVVTSEIGLALSRRGHPAASTVRAVRNWVLPIAALAIFLRRVVGLPGDSLWARLALTATCVAIVVAAQAFVNNAVFEAAPEGNWRRKVPRLLRDLVGVLLVGFAAALVYQFVWDREIEGALAALGVTSIVVGLALQEPLGNLFSGVMLLMERPFEVGDSIEVGSVSGTVKEINWRSAHIESGVGVVQVVPNSTLNKEVISNYSRPTPTRTEMIDLSFCHDDPPNKVHEVLLELVKATPGVLKKPKPIAATMGYGEYAISYRLIYRTLEDDRWKVRNDVVTRIWYAARRHGLTMPYPVSVNLQYQQRGSFRAPQPAVSDTVARFPGIPPLPDPQGATPETAVRSLRFGKGETLYSEGDPLDGVFLVVSGAVSVQLAREGRVADIAVVRPGEFLGEEGMYGRQSADTRAIALEDTDVLQFGPETVRTLFEASPRLARETGTALDVRRKALQSARAAMRAR